MGSHAEYVAVSTNSVAAMPRNLTFEDATALVFGGMTSLIFLRDKAKIQPGERVLINGASGAVGTAAVQLAKHFGAVVTGVCSASNAELVRSLGAARVIDYAKQDFTQSGEIYDIISTRLATAPSRAANARSHRAAACCWWCPVWVRRWAQCCARREPDGRCSPESAPRAPKTCAFWEASPSPAPSSLWSIEATHSRVSQMLTHMSTRDTRGATS
jgi:hypothetical protein